jgi:hypothetical protein
LDILLSAWTYKAISDRETDRLVVKAKQEVSTTTTLLVLEIMEIKACHNTSALPRKILRLKKPMKIIVYNHDRFAHVLTNHDLSDQNK